MLSKVAIPSMYDYPHLVYIHTSSAVSRELLTDNRSD